MQKNRIQVSGNKGKKFGRGITLWLAALFAVATLANCHVEYDDGYYTPLPTYETQILSDLDADGDIAFTLPDMFTVTPASTSGSILAGVDPVYGYEFRGFLTFPMRGVSGVPRYAEIESATLEVFINSVSESVPGRGVPLIMDLVSFSPPILIASDFDRLPLVTVYANIVFADDAGYFLSFDVTPLMVEAQRLDLNDFQIRLLLDSALAGSGLVEIEDDAVETAPLVTVTYY